MLKFFPTKQNKMTRYLEEGYPLWIIYLDIVKFHEVEFRVGTNTCKKILEELEQEIRITLKQDGKQYVNSFVESRGGDDFVIYLVPAQNHPWTVNDVAEKWVVPLEKRLNNRLNNWLSEIIKLRQGVVQCKIEPGRSPEYVLYAAVKESFLLNKSKPDPLYFSRREEISRLFGNPDYYLKMAFQPILQVQTGEVFGFEALARLSETETFHNIRDLFPFAEKIGMLYPIETLCRRKAITTAPAVLRKEEILFLNINPQVLSDPDFASGQTRELLVSHGFHPSNVVLEITECNAIKDFAVFRQALDHYRSQGYQIALDDVGAGYSSFQSIAELHPDFLKIDRSLISGVNSDPIKWALLDTFVTFSRRIGCRILAEGIETAEELRTVVQLGVDYVQGFYLARPEFQRAIINEVALGILKNNSRVLDNNESDVRSIIEPLSLFDAVTKVKTVENYFRDNPNELMIGVVNSNQIVGTVTRDKFFTFLGSRYGVSLYEGKPISLLMDRNPLKVEDTTPIEEVSNLAMERSRSKLYEGIVVVNQQKPIGMVSVAALMKAMADWQIQIARGVNPLTGLPGNLSIDQEIRKRLDKKERFGIIYADLNQFKHYNDIYGFRQGDNAIRLLSDVLVKEAFFWDNDSFVGHIGGDDFIVILNDKVTKNCCQGILQRFKQESSNLLDAQDLTVALACLNIPGNSAETTLTIAEKAAKIKKDVKNLGGNAYQCNDV